MDLKKRHNRFFEKEKTLILSFVLLLCVFSFLPGCENSDPMQSAVRGLLDKYKELRGLKGSIETFPVEMQRLLGNENYERVGDDISAVGTDKLRIINTIEDKYDELEELMEEYDIQKVDYGSDEKLDEFRELFMTVFEDYKNEIEALKDYINRQLYLARIFPFHKTAEFFHELMEESRISYEAVVLFAQKERESWVLLAEFIDSN